MSKWPRWAVVVVGSVVWLAVSRAEMALMAWAEPPRGEVMLLQTLAYNATATALLAVTSYGLVRALLALGAPSHVWISIPVGWTPQLIWTLVHRVPLLGVGDFAGLAIVIQPILVFAIPVAGGFVAAHRRPAARHIVSDERVGPHGPDSKSTPTAGA